MEKLDGKTSDITADNVEKLRELFPEAFTEGKIDFSALQKALGESIDTESERYSMTWHGKSDAIKMALKQSTATLLPQKAESKDWDTTENLFIEGDNLEVLRILQDSYRGKVKMIYIDPPYNTGHDFVYTDSFSDNIKNYKEKVCTAMQANADTSGRYHTNWLNMMYPRLRLARNLLRDDGAIFISIDDNELANLRKICDEIFGEENFIGMFSVENNPKGRENGKFISVTNEYCLVYAKINEVVTFEKIVPKHASDMTEDENGDFVRRSGKRVLMGENFLNNLVTNFNSPKHYTAYIKDSDLILKQEKALSDLDKDLLENNYNRFVTFRDNTFVENTYSKEKFQQLFESGSLDIRDSKIYEKHFSDLMQIKSMLTNNEYEAIIDNKKIVYKIDLKTTSAKQQLEELLGGEYFSFPKNVNFLQHLISLQDDNSAIILDFFAGSGTTAHAVMALNAEDGGNRKWICVQIPEGTGDDSDACKEGYKTIADIGKERIRRAGEKIKKDFAEKLAERAVPLDTGFKVFALNETNFTQWDADTKDIQASLLEQLSPLKENRTDEDAVYEILLKYGIDPTTPIEELSLAGKKVFSLAGNYLLICLEEKITLDTIEEMAKLAPHRAVFYDNGFADDTVKANAEQTLKKAGVKEIMVI